MLGPTSALAELLRQGCSLATEDWVDNHWRLILWKLAGMVCLDPEHKFSADGKRWSWNEVLRQLLYRYEKELNGGSRPALRLITTQDAPASLPMTLCISNIFWTEAGIGPDGFAILPHPELELTDGWYRLRAEVDEPLARAARKGHLQIGRKLEVAGAKLSTGRSEPCEVLEAYSTVHLILMGNATHLAPWHAKLGFMPKPPITTLNSLTPDGGLVQLADLVVAKMYPIAYIEFVEENGRQRREGPRKEDEEFKVHERWLAQREREEDKLRQEIRGKHNIYNDWVDRLMRKSRGHFYPKEEDSPPNDLEDMFDRLVDGEDDINRLASRLSPMNAGWLADFITNRVLKEQEQADEEIEQDLKKICPPRNVRSFRVLFMTDANTSRRPGTRTAEITVWDVLTLSFDDGKPGYFKEGQRFLITNLQPTQHGAWMRHTDEDSRVYLCTRRNSRWTKL
ncbi:hypothetical protein OF83DRAFT_1048027 [Amylostereum chailletii]|nr:hypothetical protein OF83DRAFT_1048027 [Amylostereum chailletii]